MRGSHGSLERLETRRLLSQLALYQNPQASFPAQSGAWGSGADSAAASDPLDTFSEIETLLR